MNLCFPAPPSNENNKIKNNITPCCFGYMMNEEKRKTENSPDQKVSVFPELRESCVERDTDALFACCSFLTAETGRSQRC